MNQLDEIQEAWAKELTPEQLATQLRNADGKESAALDVLQGTGVLSVILGAADAKAKR